MMRTGISSLLSYVLYVGVGISVVGLMVMLGTPIIDTLRDASSYEQATEQLRQLDATITDVAGQGTDTTVSYSLSPGRGQYTIDGQDVLWTITTRAEPIQRGGSEELGPLSVSSSIIDDETHEITVNLSYHDNERLTVQGFNGSIGGGRQSVSITHAGTQDGATVITLTR